MTGVRSEGSGGQADIRHAARGTMVRARPAIAADRLPDARLLAIVAAPPALAACALAVAVAPVTACVMAIVAGVLALARCRPPWAFAAAVLLFGFEGSVKLLLGLEPTPVPIESRALGAGALDLVLFAAIAGLVAADRLRTPRALWQRAGRPGRVVIVLLFAWLGVSVLQIPLGGDLGQGLEGFRIFHAYALVAVGAAIVFAARGDVVRRARVALAIGLVVSLYAAVRVAIGPAFEEVVFATSGARHHTIGTSLRAVGSFSSAVGMQSFLTPLCAFALVAGYLEPRLRLVAWPAAALALVGLWGAYGRAPMVAIGASLALALAVVVAAADISRRRKLTAGLLSAIVLASMYGGLEVAGRTSPELKIRAGGVTKPLSDVSVSDRLTTWRQAIADVSRHPLGRGVGTVGAASDREDGRRRTTDSSVVKVAVEQGSPVAALLVAGLVGAVALLFLRLRRLTGERRAIGVAALAGFASYLVLSTTGEYVEQPGKVVAWGLLGVAAAQAMGGLGEVGKRRPRRPRPRRGGVPRAVWAAAAAAMVLVPLGLTLDRDPPRTATKQIFPQPAGPLPAVQEPAYYRELLRALTAWMGSEERLGPWDYADTAFRAGPQGSIVMSLDASSPARAERILDALSRQVARAARREVVEEATALARADERRLARGGMAPGERARLHRRAREFRRLAASPPPRVVPGRPASTPEPQRWPDRVADAFPGDLPGRPSPVWAALAGGLVAAVGVGVAALVRATRANLAG
ncbi:MAG TPA: hypothetical protein VF715_16725 [Thermoleophilaceae bacterium]